MTILLLTSLKKDSKTHEFSALEFLARITPHIPNKWEQTNRYFGTYSSRTRSVLKKQTSTDSISILPCSFEPRTIRKASRSWAALIKQVYEINPLACPKCNATIRIVGFITDPNEILRLLKNLNIPSWTKPVPVGANAPPTSDPVLIPFYE